MVFSKKETMALHAASLAFRKLWSRRVRNISEELLTEIIRVQTVQAKIQLSSANP